MRAILIGSALLFLFGVGVGCDDDAAGDVTKHDEFHEKILSRLEKAYPPLPGCSFRGMGGRRTQEDPFPGTGNGRSHGGIPPGSPDTGTWHSRRSRTLLLDVSSLRVQELFNAVSFSSKPWYRDHWDDYGSIRSLDDEVFLKSTGMLQAVCRAATEFYARRFQDLPLSFEVDHAGGPPNFDFSSHTLMMTERPWESNFIQITAVCSRKEGLMWIQVSYFKHWDGREPEARRRDVPPSES